VRGTLFATGKEHWDKSALGAKDVSWKKSEETARHAMILSHPRGSKIVNREA
jgi:hypothetical protein